MKKLSIALALALVLILAIASVASADNGPHGRFNGSTQACASCHRAHSAVSSGDMLLTYDTIWALCTSCHDGTGAYTNVVDGYYDTGTQTGYGARVAVDDLGKSAFANNTGEAGLGLFGGGFVHARMLTDFGTNEYNPVTGQGQTLSTNKYDSTGALIAGQTNYWSGAATDDINASASAWAIMNVYDASSAKPTGRDVTSAHRVGQSALFTTAFTGSGSDIGVVWGAGDYQAAGTALNSASTKNGLVNDLELECTSCHTPHGAGGKVGGLSTGVPTPSYRLLEFTPAGSGGFETDVIRGANNMYRLYWDRPSVMGVSVPDATNYWYTPNNDITNDPAVGGYRGADGYYMANFAGRGDYGGIYFAYVRPSSVNGTRCLAGNLATDAGADCAASPNSVAFPNFNNNAAQNVMGFWCATCHDRYLAPGGGNTTLVGISYPSGGSRTTDSGDVAYHYRHRSQGVIGSVSTTVATATVIEGLTAANSYPAAVIGLTLGDSLSGTAPNFTYSTSPGQYTCLSCHNAHGTVSQSTTLSNAATYSDNSAMLKADNRAICTRCHGFAVNFFNTVTTPAALFKAPYP